MNTIYYTAKADGIITGWSKNEKALIPQLDEQVLSTDKEIVTGRDGKLYFKGNEPDPTEEEVQAEALVEAKKIITAHLQKEAVQTMAFSASEFSALAKAGLFDPWAIGREYSKGDRFVFDGIVYEVQQPVTALEHQKPGGEGMLAVYRPLSVNAETGEEPDGSQENPYAFINGMDVHAGIYYTYEGKLYLAKGDMTPCVWNPGTAGLWQWELVG